MLQFKHQANEVAFDPYSDVMRASTRRAQKGYSSQRLQADENLFGIRYQLVTSNRSLVDVLRSNPIFLRKDTSDPDFRLKLQ